MRIALIDDAPVSRALFERIASELGYAVISCVQLSSSALVEAVRAAAPDVAVVDGRFGDALGTSPETATRLRTLVASLAVAVPDALVAVVAALGETELVRAAERSGARFVIPRPYVHAGVAATLAAMASERYKSGSKPA